eukprot:29449-Rhodomonas_salina.3
MSQALCDGRPIRKCENRRLTAVRKSRWIQTAWTIAHTLAHLHQTLCNLKQTDSLDHGRNRRLRKAGGADATIAAMRLHPNDWGLQVGACMTLASLVARGGAQMLQLTVTLGGIEAVVDAMRSNGFRHKKVLVAGACALQLFCQGSVGAELSHKRISAVSAMMSRMREDCDGRCKDGNAV